jgi:hypothetical protein
MPIGWSIPSSLASSKTRPPDMHPYCKVFYVKKLIILFNLEEKDSTMREWDHRTTAGMKEQLPSSSF